jgi:ribosomal protein S18 acetylase RimI-like enzyme
LLAKAAECAFRVDLAQDSASDRFVGYCVSTVDRALVGEVESIFVDAGCRGLGIGDRLMRRALAWMDRQGAQAKKVGVAAGNEEAIAFYRRYGFLTRYIILAHKRAGSSNAPET